MNLPIQITIHPAASAPAVQYWRHPHDLEMLHGTASPDPNRVYTGRTNGVPRDDVTDYDKGLPEVYRLLPDHQTPLSDAWIWLWRNLNPELSDEKFCAILDNTLAFCNHTGWPGRRNIILREDMTAKPPAFDAPRVCGGALLKGYEQGGNLMIESMLTSQPVPTAAWVMERPWLWFYGTTIVPTGMNYYMEASVQV